ncbi:MAG: CBS domain-containing protein [Cyanobacteria bacterium J06635_1]
MLNIRDIMTTPVVVIRNSATVESAIELMRTQGVRSLIIDKCHAEGSYGILTEKDIVYKVIACGSDPANVRVCSIMRQPCIQIPASATVQEAAQFLADAGIHRAPVVEHNELLGIISVTDILFKGNPSLQLEDELAQRTQEALQHTRIINDEKAQVEQACDTAWQIFEERHINFAANG